MAYPNAVAELDTRIERFYATDDPAEVLDPAALAAARLLASTETDDLAVLHTLAIYYHCRVIAAARAGPATEDMTDSMTAMSYFHALFQRAPDLLPDGIAEVCGEVWPPSPDVLVEWNSRATGLARAGRSRGDLAVIDDALGLFRLLVDAARGSEHEAGYLSGLGLAWRSRFAVSGDAEDADSAVEAGDAAIGKATTDEVRALCSSNAAISRMERYAFSGSFEDVSSAVELLRTSERLGSRPMAGRMSNLAACLASRYQITGSMPDLGEAVSLLTAASDLADDPAEAAEYLTNLAGAHSLRFTATGDNTELDLGLESARKAATLAKGSDAWPAALNHLGLAAKARYRRTQESDDLDEAVSALGRAVDALLPQHRALAPGIWSNLSAALRLRAVAAESVTDIDRSVQAAEKAVELGALDSAPVPRLRSTLAAALSRRFDLTGQPDDLDRACDQASTAAGDLSEDAPQHAALWMNAAIAWRRRSASPVSLPEDLRRAVEAYDRASAGRSSPPLVRAIAAYDLGTLLREAGDGPNSLLALRNAVDLVAEVTDDRLVPDDQGHQLTQLAGIGTAAAAAALDAEDDELALDLLERGRGVLLTKLLAIRGDLTRLRAHDSALATRFDQIRKELNREIGETAPVRGRATRRRRAAAEYHAVMDEIGGIPGFEDFPRPERADPPRSPVDGPVVVLNVAAHRCDALLVGQDGVRSLPLPGLTASEAVDQANALLRAVHVSSEDSEKKVSDVLGWMWDSFVEEVLAAIGVGGGPGGPAAIWWMPTGPLSVLPIHAAGHHSTPGLSVLDRAASSYTPTLSVLRTAVAATPVDSSRPLVVSVPEAPGKRVLPAALAEAKAVVAQLSGAVSLTGEEATRRRVGSELETSTWAHFACHATTQPREPFASHLALQDGALTVRDVATLASPGGRLAYLSACGTAFGGVSLSDEAIHISSSFQMIGYRNVVGTLWRVGDLTAAKAAELIYPGFRTASTVQAVHQAQLLLRNRYRDAPTSWAAHVHIGP